MDLQLIPLQSVHLRFSNGICWLPV